MILLKVLFLLFLYNIRQFVDSCSIENCLKCSKNGLDCESCKNNYIYSREYHACIAKFSCPLGQYKSSINGKCDKCDASCTLCNGPNNYNCFKCNSGYYPTFYKQFMKCSTCKTNYCHKCNDIGICMECKRGYFLNKTDSKF